MGAPVQFPGANFILGPPPGCEELVVPLPIRRDDDGVRLISCWDLSPEEKAEIARTGKVWLSVWGRHTHPPVLVSGIRGHVIAEDAAPPLT